MKDAKESAQAQLALIAAEHGVDATQRPEFKELRELAGVHEPAHHEVHSLKGITFEAPNFPRSFRMALWFLLLMGIGMLVMLAYMDEILARWPGPLL